MQVIHKLSVQYLLRSYYIVESMLGISLETNSMVSNDNNKIIIFRLMHATHCSICFAYIKSIIPHNASFTTIIPI